MKFLKTTLVAAAIAVAPTAASAASIALDFFSSGQLSEARDAKSAFDYSVSTASENFEGFAVETSTLNGLNTGIGTITTVPGNKPGASAIGITSESIVRNSTAFGRYNTTFSGQKWLDSNDNADVILDIGDTGDANRLSLFITDVDDVGAIAFQILSTNGVMDFVYNGTQKLANGNLILAMFDFGASLASEYTITLSIDAGDGFGIDDLNATVVPLPAGGLLLLTAIGGLAVFRRWKKA